MRGEVVFIDGVQVENVLVEPGMADDATDIETRAGEEIAYTLRLPARGAVHSRTACTVRGETLRIAGFSDAYDAAGAFGAAWSLPWAQTVLVSRVEGEMDATVAVVRLSGTLDELGDARTERVIVWEGLAQARMEPSKATDESEGVTNESDATETWRFVMPWDDLFSTLRPRDTLIAWNGADYDVCGIADIDQHHESACFTAVRHG